MDGADKYYCYVWLLQRLEANFVSHAVAEGSIPLSISRPRRGTEMMLRREQLNCGWTSFVVDSICTEGLCYCKGEVPPPNDGCKNVPNLDSHSIPLLGSQRSVPLKQQQPWLKRLDTIQTACFSKRGKLTLQKSQNPVTLLRRWILISIGVPLRLTEGPTVARVSGPAAWLAALMRYFPATWHGDSLGEV